MLAIFFSASEYAYNMLRFFRNFSLNMLIVVMLIKKEGVNEYNNTCHRTIKRKPIDVKDYTYGNTGKEASDKDSKFKVGDHVRISKYKNIFAKGYTPNWSEEIFMMKESFSICKEIEDHDFSLFMVSFDIQSLFSKIALDETIDICVDQAF